MRVLVDTSVCINHLHRTDEWLKELLHEGKVCTHPAVIGELACGAIAKRERFLDQLVRLPGVREESTEAVLRLIETDKLWGRGLGWTDVQILASCRSERIQLWTRDVSLRKAATALRLLQPARRER